MQKEEFTVDGKTYEIRETFNVEKDSFEVRVFDGQKPVSPLSPIKIEVVIDGKSNGHDLRKEFFCAVKNRYIQSESESRL